MQESGNYCRWKIDRSLGVMRDVGVWCNPSAWTPSTPSRGASTEDRTADFPKSFTNARLILQPGF